MQQLRVNVSVDNAGVCEVVLWAESLTPQVARRAMEVAGGLGAWGVVSDGERSYRVTKRTCRLMRSDWDPYYL